MDIPKETEPPPPLSILFQCLTTLRVTAFLRATAQRPLNSPCFPPGPSGPPDQAGFRMDQNSCEHSAHDTFLCPHVPAHPLCGHPSSPVSPAMEPCSLCSTTACLSSLFPGSPCQAAQPPGRDDFAPFFILIQGSLRPGEPHAESHVTWMQRY